MNSIKSSSCLITTLNSTLLRRCDKFTYLRSSLLNGNNPIVQNDHLIHTTPNLQLFWEKHRKGGYNKNLKRLSQKELILDGLKELKKEIVLWKNEVKEKLECDPIVIFRPGTSAFVFLSNVFFSFVTISICPNKSRRWDRCDVAI